MRVVDVFKTLVHSQDTAYVISGERRLVRMNEGWTRFANANGGAAILARWTRGARMDDALPYPLRTFYQDAFARTLSSGEPWEHTYECSSPDTFRRFRMHLYPCAETFLVAVHSRVIEAPHSRPQHAPELQHYMVDGVITMCSHCRRTRNRSDAERWDWVPAFVAEMPTNISHGLCPPCSEYYHHHEAVDSRSDP